MLRIDKAMSYFPKRLGHISCSLSHLIIYVSGVDRKIKSGGQQLVYFGELASAQGVRVIDRW